MERCAGPGAVSQGFAQGLAASPTGAISLRFGCG